MRKTIEVDILHVGKSPIEIIYNKKSIIGLVFFYKYVNATRFHPIQGQPRVTTIKIK